MTLNVPGGRRARHRHGAARRVLVALTAVAAMCAIAAPPATAQHRATSTGRLVVADYVTGQIYSLNPDGSGLTQLTDVQPPLFPNDPTWSPDGTRILFTIEHGARGRIWIMNADGSDQHQLAREAAGYRDYQPRFTPDGEHIVWVRCQPGDGVCAIWIMEADGTHHRALTPYQEDDVVDFWPSVSPDGSTVAFTRFGYRGFNARIWLMGIDGSNPHPITAARLEAGAPEWSPDGSRITFTNRFVRLYDFIYSMNADGSDVQRLTHVAYPHNDAVSVYSPDGSQIAFFSDRRYDDFCCLDLFVMNADGSDRHLVHTGLFGVFRIDWSGTASSAAASTGAPRVSRPAAGSAARWLRLARQPFARP
jgi:Tol biopolymer transport system component